MNFIKKFFKFEERNATMRGEVIGGIVTFLAMSYILVVNPGIASGLWSGEAGIPYGGVFFATVVGAFLATLIMALLANLPVALAPGMGVNAFFVGVIIGQYGYTWQEALALSFMGGLLFLLISLTPLRRTLIKAIPNDLKAAISVGIGFFIAFVGLRLSGVFVWNGQLSLGDLTSPTVLLGLFSVISIFIVHSLKHGISKFSFIISIVFTALIGLFLGEVMGVAGMPNFEAFNYDQFADIKDVAFVGVIEGFKTVFNQPLYSSVFLIFALLFVDIFDTAGTLVAVGRGAKLEDSEGNIPNLDKALLADSIGTLLSSTLGTPEITSYVESTTGVEAGAKTGLSSVVVAILFLISLALFPIFNLFTHSAVTLGALVLVGVLMAQQLKEINWSDMTSAITCFVTIAGMLFTSSIADGIAFGFIMYSLIKLIRGEIKSVHPIIYGSSILFIIYFALMANLL
ncbi:Guanine/hypoxanthine permease PbuO [Acholeplasma oculi]|uniref:Xanthine/uracil/vitamin C permease n=1 Tax=Acholeplasma oculi TaxID=35623 RepID=A0A061A869_9MOLU|nr:NCS2 family permease [Acholeplasma oculi]CDR30095.1 Xanthine/uracil/vitamin C permease [Acholeplasma oculi]SKC44857.1 putative MFS transporter, AGZA family, xanthine/uracil permease [Acholeplasma oculi]SUT88371.1 Guanine/hypoxanthine permease PbuO [Acholeplasma oculi]